MTGLPTRPQALLGEQRALPTREVLLPAAAASKKVSLTMVPRRTAAGTRSKLTTMDLVGVPGSATTTTMTAVAMTAAAAVGGPTSSRSEIGLAKIANTTRFGASVPA